MTLLEDVRQEIVTQTDDQDAPPAHMVIESNSETGNYLVEASWPIVVDESADLGDPFIESHPKTEVVLSDALESRVHNHFQQFEEAVRDVDATVHEPSLIQPFHDPESDFPNEVHQQFEEPLAFMARVTASTHTTPPNDIWSPLVEQYSDIDPDLSAEDIENIGFGFSDRRTTHLTNMDLDILTPAPHRYYEGFSTLEDLLDEAGDTNAFEGMADGRYRISHTRLFRSDGDIPPTVVESAESEMQQLVHDTLNGVPDYAIEAQYLDYADGEFGFYLHIPINTS